VICTDLQRSNAEEVEEPIRIFVMVLKNCKLDVFMAVQNILANYSHIFNGLHSELHMYQVYMEQSSIGVPRLYRLQLSISLLL
jgi:hypothetical protein